MKQALRVVKELEGLLFEHQLKKSHVCKAAGIQNSIFSYVIKRARDGKEPNAEHVEKIRAAIEKLVKQKEEKAS